LIQLELRCGRLVATLMITLLDRAADVVCAMGKGSVSAVLVIEDAWVPGQVQILDPRPLEGFEACEGGERLGFGLMFRSVARRVESRERTHTFGMLEDWRLEGLFMALLPLA